jgi:hypothetical protein
VGRRCRRKNETACSGTRTVRARQHPVRHGKRRQRTGLRQHVGRQA